MSFVRTARTWLAGTCVLILATGCGGQSARPTPPSESSPNPRPAATTTTAPPRVLPTALPTAVAVQQTPTPGGTATEEVASASLALIVLAPLDGSQVEAAAVRVFGKVPQDAVVAVNGVPAEVRLDGTFASDLVLDDDVVGIEVSATDVTGAVATSELAVFRAAASDGLPLDILYPRDGMAVSWPSIEVVGVSNADAVVAVNGTPVAVNALGIFSQQVELTEGVNFIEVTATNAGGAIRSFGIAVFYTP